MMFFSKHTISSIALLVFFTSQPAKTQGLAVPHTVTMKITRHYLNIPIGPQARMRLLELRTGGGLLQREIPVQLAEDSVGFWIYIDVSAFKGQKITLSGTVSQKALGRIYQDDRINGADSLYAETNRPQFHFTVKRGWNNDVNGPIWYNGQYHLFWQAFPFGLMWNTGFMYWGHAVSKDMLHWQELDPALINDSLGSPWSGTAVIDRNNDGGWGKNALVLYYACFDRISQQQVQCIAYSTDGAKTFQHDAANPILNTDWELGTTSTRDPKVFWYEPAKTWVMVLFEEDGMSFFNSTDMHHWTRKSHFPGLYECPDFFELPVEIDTPATPGSPAAPGTPTGSLTAAPGPAAPGPAPAPQKKWVLHGGSADYVVGTFDGKTFTPETPKQRYAEGKNGRGEDCLYAAESFENAPDGRRVQMAWGRIVHPGMPFTQMMLFPTEFSLHSTARGIQLRANPIKEINSLHRISHEWTNLTPAAANAKLSAVPAGPLHVRMTFTVADGNELDLRYQGNELLHLTAADLHPVSSDLHPGPTDLEILLDKTVAEIFLNHGERYIIHQLPPAVNNNSLEFASEKYGPAIQTLNVYELNSVWPKPL